MAIARALPAALVRQRRGWLRKELCACQVVSPAGVVKGACWIPYEPSAVPLLAENVAAKGRVPYALLAIMGALRAFPGQVRCAR